MHRCRNTQTMLTNERKRHVVIVALKVKNDGLKISRFMKDTRYFRHKILISKSEKKINFKRSDSIRTLELVQEVKQNFKDNAGNSMRSIKKTICV